LRIANPRYSRLPVGATGPAPANERFVSTNNTLKGCWVLQRSWGRLVSQFLAPLRGADGVGAWSGGIAWLNPRLLSANPPGWTARRCSIGRTTRGNLALCFCRAKRDISPTGMRQAWWRNPVGVVANGWSITKGSSCVATQGCRAESRWNSGNGSRLLFILPVFPSLAVRAKRRRVPAPTNF